MINSKWFLLGSCILIFSYYFLYQSVNDNFNYLFFLILGVIFIMIVGFVQKMFKKFNSHQWFEIKIIALTILYLVICPILITNFHTYSIFVCLIILIIMLLIGFYIIPNDEYCPADKTKLFWLSDNPLDCIDNKNDLLDRMKYLNNVKDFVKDFYYKKDSAVIAITSKWGNGKTTFINSLIQYLKDDDDCVLLPWIRRNFTEKIFKSTKIKYLKDHIKYKSILGHILLFLKQLPQSYIIEKITSIILLCLIVLLLYANKTFEFNIYSLKSSLFFEMPLLILTTMFIIGLLIIIPFENVIKNMIVPIKACCFIIQTWFFYIYRVLKVLRNKKDFIIIQFNPWYFQDEENLSEQFFNQISLQLKNNGMSGEWKKLSSLINTYSKLIGNDDKVNIANILLKSSEKKDILKIKAEIDHILRYQSSKVIVVIDDIDRLMPEEIYLMFKLIRNVADFKNVLYLISFDEELVNNSLGTCGSEFLKKIINANFPLPIISKTQISKCLYQNINFLTEKIEQIETIPEDNFQSQLNSGGLLDLFNNIRDIKRCMNTTYNLLCRLENEIDLFDLITITSILLESKGLYNKIYNNKELFCGLSSSIVRMFEGMKDHDELTKEKDDKVNQILANEKEEQKEIFKRLLYSLFPNLNNRNLIRRITRREAKISCPECFDRYFSYLLPDNYLSNSEMNTILDLTSNEINFEQKLLELKTKNQIEIFLDRLGDYLDDLEVKPVFKTFCKIADKLENEKEEVHTFDSNVQKASYLMYSLLLKILDEKKRFELLKESLNSSDNIFIMTVFRDVIFEVNEETFKTENRLFLNDKYLNEINQILLKKIKEKNTNELIKYLRFDWILSTWKKIENSEEINKHLKLDEFTKNPNNVFKLIQFLHKPFSRATSLDNDNESEEGIKYAFRTNLIVDLIDMSSLQEKVINAINNQTNPDKITLLQGFQKVTWG